MKDSLKDWGLLALGLVCGLMWGWGLSTPTEVLITETDTIEMKVPEYWVKSEVVAPHVVRFGETLSEIGAEYGVLGATVYGRNKGLPGVASKDEVRAGVMIWVPMFEAHWRVKADSPESNTWVQSQGPR